jgi:hypothetical protein
VDGSYIGWTSLALDREQAASVRDIDGLKVALLLG